jgi:hypothetical protein
LSIIGREALNFKISERGWWDPSLKGAFTQVSDDEQNVQVWVGNSGSGPAVAFQTPGEETPTNLLPTPERSDQTDHFSVETLPLIVPLPRIPSTLTDIREWQEATLEKDWALRILCEKTINRLPDAEGASLADFMRVLKADIWNPEDKAS